MNCEPQPCVTSIPLDEFPESESRRNMALRLAARRATATVRSRRHESFALRNNVLRVTGGAAGAGKQRSSSPNTGSGTLAELSTFERKKPHVNIGTIGHVDHGKTTLTAVRRRRSFCYQGLVRSVSGVNGAENGVGPLLSYVLMWTFEGFWRGIVCALL